MHIPDKEWMKLVEKHRHLPEYIKGVESFLEFVDLSGNKTKIPCPCVKCCNAEYLDRAAIRRHLIVHGIMSGYTFWNFHGEKRPRMDDSNAGTSRNVNISDYHLVQGHDSHIEVHDYHDNEEGHDHNNAMDSYINDIYPNDNSTCDHESDENAKSFYNLKNDSHLPLYDGSKVSKSSALLKLHHLKTVGQWTNESFTMLLKFLKDEVLPVDSNLPDSYDKCKNFLEDIGPSYSKHELPEQNMDLKKSLTEMKAQRQEDRDETNVMIAEMQTQLETRRKEDDARYEATNKRFE